MFHYIVPTIKKYIYVHKEELGGPINIIYIYTLPKVRCFRYNALYIYIYTIATTSRLVFTFNGDINNFNGHSRYDMNNN